MFPLSLCLLILSPPHTFEDRISIDVDGVTRTAIVEIPACEAPAAGRPLIFAFHGHGGTARHSHDRFALHKLWPDAVVVYMQGLTGVRGVVTDPEGKRTGWQMNPGDQKDRDVRFFDAMLQKMESSQRIDPNRVYAMGHSNGSRFVCVLWKLRGDKFAAVSTSGGQGGLMLVGVKPLPLLAIAGENDKLVPFAGQKASIGLLIAQFKIDPSQASQEGAITKMEGKDRIELATMYHSGGHEWNEQMNVEIVKFFKRQKKK
jgi:polyhydroxybutyrate depolymerase